MLEVFATTTGIFLSIDSGSDDIHPYTVIKRIRGGSIDLEKVSMINEFSRKFTTTDLSIAEGIQILKEIDQSRKYKLPLQMLGAALVASFFTLMLGGGWNDFACSFVIGICGYGLALFLERLRFNNFCNILCLWIKRFTIPNINLFRLRSKLEPYYHRFNHDIFAWCCNNKCG